MWEQVRKVKATTQISVNFVLNFFFLAQNLTLIITAYIWKENKNSISNIEMTEYPSVRNIINISHSYFSSVWFIVRITQIERMERMEMICIKQKKKIHGEWSSSINYQKNYNILGFKFIVSPNSILRWENMSPVCKNIEFLL